MKIFHNVLVVKNINKKRVCNYCFIYSVAFLFSQKPDLYLKDNNGKTPLDLAKGRGYQDIVAFLDSTIKMDKYLGFQYVNFIIYFTKILLITLEAIKNFICDCAFNSFFKLKSEGLIFEKYITAV